MEKEICIGVYSGTDLPTGNLPAFMNCEVDGNTSGVTVFLRKVS